MKESIIGKKYIPCDNSWSVNVTASGDHPYKNEPKYLAGAIGLELEAKVVTIVSEPFKCNVSTFGMTDPKSVKDMVMVEYEKETFMVMFKQSQIVE
jgi:hypothetical protein